MVGGNEGTGLAGGVCDLAPSCVLAVREDACSGDIAGGAACGMEPSNSSARSNVL